MATLETSVQGHAVPRFSIFQEYSTEKVTTLKHCFIERFVISRSNPPTQIVPKDGLVYTAVYDFRFPQGTDKVNVIISFQQHTYGRFAVMRLADRNRR